MTASAVIDFTGDRSECGSGCEAFIERWRPWWERQRERPMALLAVPPSHDSYMDSVGPKSRNMIRKAQLLYGYREFDRNRYLDDLYDINVSKAIRSGGRMTGHYLRRPEPTYGGDDLCLRHDHTWQGAFSLATGKLVAYCNLVLLNDLGVVNTILSHADAPASGNGLFSWMAEFCRSRGTGWIHYLTLTSSPEGLARFKISVGFREVTVT